jgi:putative pyruvate formate lyase activating enzyme
LGRRAAEAAARLVACETCPRGCGVDRASGETGVCGVGRLAVVASHGPHFGEEHCLVGDIGGSGTIFFSGCNLGCVFCQNADISHRVRGEGCDAGRLAGIMLGLQHAGCRNINLVTPSHVVPQILEALVAAAEGGLRLPLVYNTSAYDAVDTVRLLDGVVDIYMPDFKLWDKEAAGRYLTAADYPARARDAIAEMHRQVGDLEQDADGLARRGLLIRHLVMPDDEGDSAAIFTWLAALSPATFVNIMAQYRPSGRALACPTDYPGLGRGPGPEEVARALDAARAAGLTRAGAW